MLPLNIVCRHCGAACVWYGKLYYTRCSQCGAENSHKLDVNDDTTKLTRV